MRHFTTCLILTAVLTGCDSATELVNPGGPTTGSPSFPGSATADPVFAASPSADHDVDVSLLVPLLSPTFTNWTCVATGTGPICRGERLVDSGWRASDFPCTQLVYEHSTDYRTQTRYYDENYLNYFRRFHMDAPDYLSLSPTGEGTTVVIDAHLNFIETFGVPGDDQTLTVKTEGLLFQLKDTHGGVILQWSGSILEPFGGDLEIIGGNVNSVKSFVSDPDAFLAAVCHALGTDLAS
jgi:hypothetical protein